MFFIFSYRGIPQSSYKDYRQLGRGIPDRDSKIGSRNVQFACPSIRYRGRINSSLGEDLRDQQQDERRRCFDVGRFEPDPCPVACPNVPRGGGIGQRTTLEIGEQSHVLPASRSDQSIENSRERDGDHDEYAGQTCAGAVRRSNTTADNRRRTSFQGEGYFSRNGGGML